MLIIAIDIGTTTTKIIEYKNRIINKEIVQNKNPEKALKDFINKYKIKKENIESIVLTGIGADKIKLTDLNVPIKIVEEFKAIAAGGLSLCKKEEALVVSIGTGTALIRASKRKIEHLGGTGVGAGTLTNLCNRFAKTNSFDEIVELSQKGNLNKIDLRIKDATNKKIKTLPPDLTLSNFGKLSKDAKKEDIVAGIVNMVFETIGMMAAFSLKNDKIKEVVLIGNIVTIPRVNKILKRIGELQNISFITPKNAEFGVAIGAIKQIKLLKRK